MELVIANSKGMVAVSGMTMTRANVIAQRTNSDMMGLLKAQMIETLKAKMQSGIAHFLFLKKGNGNNIVREAYGTIQSSFVAEKTNGKGCSRENYATCAYYDVEKGAWRSFRWENLIKVY